MKYLVGLGNPGRRYANTRHNFGWMVLDRLADSCNITSTSEKWRGSCANADDLCLFKPHTFMNRSGEAVAQLQNGTRAEVCDILVIMDDLDLDLGTVRLRASGSSGGHRGLQSVIDSLGTSEFPRLRLGIGPCPERLPAKEFVLEQFDQDELPVVTRVVRHAAEAALCWVRKGVESAMSRFNCQIDFVENK